MKKLILCSLVAIVLSNCEVGVQKAESQMSSIVCTNSYTCITYEKVVIDSMEFGVFSSTDARGSAPYIINLTKDKLEIELLKKQLQK